jgi:hypothetical protein
VQRDLASGAMVGDDGIAGAQVECGYGSHTVGRDGTWFPVIDYCVVGIVEPRDFGVAGTSLLIAQTHFRVAAIRRHCPLVRDCHDWFHSRWHFFRS